MLKEVGKVSFTKEALDKIEKMLDKQIKKEKKKIESWDAKDFIF
jgi:ribosome-associated translation inhibitor RaiA